MTIPLNEGDSYYSGKSCNRNEIPVIEGKFLGWIFCPRRKFLVQEKYVCCLKDIFKAFFLDIFVVKNSST